MLSELRAQLEALAEKAGPLLKARGKCDSPRPDGNRLVGFVVPSEAASGLSDNIFALDALVQLANTALQAAEAVEVAREALEDIGVYGCGMLNQPIELNQPPEQWMQKRIERMEQVARQALAALTKEGVCHD